MLSRERVKYLRKLQRLRMFLVFLFLAWLYWLLMSFAEVREAQVTVKLTFQPKSHLFLLQKPFSEKGKMKINTTGFRVLQYHFFPLEFPVKEQWLETNSLGESYFLPNRHITQWETGRQNVTLLSYAKDTVWLPLEQNFSKKLAVKLPLKVAFKPGYRWVNSPVIRPDSIEVIGVPSVLENKKVLTTDTLYLDHLDHSVNLEIKLKKVSEDLYLKQKSVIFTGQVAQFTEQTFTVPIEVKNVPKGYGITLFPEEVSLTVQAPIEAFSKMKASDFELQCMIEQGVLKATSQQVLTPVLIEKPKEVDTYRMSPSYIQFFLTPLKK